MQLGNSAEMPKRLVYLEDLAKGVGVNLLWGGGDLVNGQKPGSFGYSKSLIPRRLLLKLPNYAINCSKNLVIGMRGLGGRA